MKFFSFVRGKIKNMKKGTKIGWLLVALSIVLSVWVIIAQSSRAVEENGFVVDDSGTITAYTGGLSNISGMPAGANAIAASAFATNSDITSIQIGSNITSLAPGCFAGCNSLSSVSGGSYSSIPSQCFYNCGSLSSYTIPGSVSSIGSQAFQGAGISGITIPANVSSIASDAFDETYNLTNIAVDSGNSVYSSHNSCLYNKSGSNLIRVPFGASSASIYSGCATIGSGAFSGCYGIYSLEIPSGVTTISDGAFSGSGIMEITIPKSVTSIGGQGGWTPAVIYGYNGSQAQSYANLNNIPFVSLDTPEPGPGPDPGPGPEPGPGPSPGPDPSSSSSSSSSTPSSSSQAPSSQDPQEPGSQGGGGTTPGGGGGGTGGGGTTPGGGGGTGGGGGGTHTPDATPKTADGDIDPRLIIAIAVFAAGLALIIVGRRKKAVIVKKGREDRLDD